MTGPRMIDIGLTVFFLVLGILAILGVQKFPFDDQLFPVSAAVLMILCSVAYGIRQLRNPAKLEEDTGPGAALPPFTRDQIGSVLGPAAAIAGLIAGVMILGHLIAVPLFVFAYMIWHREPLLVALAGAAIMLAFIRGLLIEVMHVAMPHPLLGDWLLF